jgi:hypothetical protein
MDFNCIPLEVQAIIVNLCPFTKTRLVNKNFVKFTQSRYDIAASVFNKKDIDKIQTKPFAVNMSRSRVCYVNNNYNIYEPHINYEPPITIYGLIDTQTEFSDMGYYICIDFLTSYNIMIQRGCTPTFVKNFIVNKIKNLKLSLYSKGVSSFTYLWLYANAAVLGFTDMNNILNITYNKEHSFELYNNLLNYFVTKIGYADYPIFL